MNDYITLKETLTHEIVIEKSRFIASVFPIHSSDEVSTLLKDVTKMYPNATHYCYACVTHDTQKYSDAGEPQGTAGLPILNIIKHQNLTNVLVVVTRYFGGIKLGTGGLARAYGQVTNEALTKASKLKYCACSVFTIEVNYNQISLLENLVSQYGKIMDKLYQTQPQYVVAIPVNNGQKFLTELANALRQPPLILNQRNDFIALN